MSKQPTNQSVSRRQPTFGRMHHVHMVGIGGIGMSSFAEVLLRRGYKVSGSDLSAGEVTQHLQTLGAKIHEGHHGPLAKGACVVVHSSAVDPTTNPETCLARENNIPDIRRSEMLGELMRMKYGIGIAGTHGKTTTTTMVGHVVGAGGFDPTVVVGGKVAAFGSNAVSGEGDIIVVEADEYDRTFLRLTPSIAVITNVEAEHMDCYDDLDDLLGAFLQFARSVPFFGQVICCIDDVHTRDLVPHIDRNVVTYGLSPDADLRAVRVSQDGRIMQFDVLENNQLLGSIRLDAPGNHNVQNALAAIAVGRELEMPFEDIARGIASFTGVQRRMHEIGEAKGVLLVDDYAHHPTEVKASLEGARGCWPDRRIIAVFQPHLYSRTRDLCPAFGQAFADADQAFIMDVYAAREEPIPGVSGECISKEAASHGSTHVQFMGDREALTHHLVSSSKSGDVVLTMGAGDIWRLNRDVLAKLEAAT